MNWLQKHEELVLQLKHTINWIASFLGLGTVVGLVNIFVGIASGAWILWQLYLSVKYDLPVKRARAQKLLTKDQDDAPTDSSSLE